MAEDDRAVRERLAALEAEVKAEADAARERKEAAVARLREQQAEQAELRVRQQALVTKSKPARRAEPDDDRPESRYAGHDRDDGDGGLAGAIELASRANRVKNELARKPRKGEK